MRGLLQNVSYRVAAGDATSDDYTLTVQQPPSATVDEVAYRFPDYMRLSHRTDVGGAIKAYEGTHVTIRATANMQLASAVIQFSDDDTFATKAEEFPMALRDGTRLEGTLQLRIRDDGTSPGFYRVQVKTPSGATDPRPVAYPISIDRDRAPLLVLHHPRGDQKLPANAVVPLAYRARDPDFLLHSVTLFYKRVGDEHPRQFPLGDSPLNEPLVEATYRLPLQTLSVPVEPGSRIAYWLEARDNLEPFPGRDANVARTPVQHFEIIAPVEPQHADQQFAADEQQAQSRLDETRAAETDGSEPTAEDIPPGDEPPLGDSPEEAPPSGDPGAATPESPPGEQPPAGDPSMPEDNAGDGGASSDPADGTPNSHRRERTTRSSRKIAGSHRGRTSRSRPGTKGVVRGGKANRGPVSRGTDHQRSQGTPSRSAAAAIPVRRTGHNRASRGANPRHPRQEPVSGRRRPTSPDRTDSSQRGDRPGNGLPVVSLPPAATSRVRMPPCAAAGTGTSPAAVTKPRTIACCASWRTSSAIDSRQQAARRGNNRRPRQTRRSHRRMVSPATAIVGTPETVPAESLHTVQRANHRTQARPGINPATRARPAAATNSGRAKASHHRRMGVAGNPRAQAELQTAASLQRGMAIPPAASRCRATQPQLLANRQRATARRCPATARPHRETVNRPPATVNRCPVRTQRARRASQWRTPEARRRQTAPPEQFRPVMALHKGNPLPATPTARRRQNRRGNLRRVHRPATERRKPANRRRISRRRRLHRRPGRPCRTLSRAMAPPPGMRPQASRQPGRRPVRQPRRTDSRTPGMVPVRVGRPRTPGSPRHDRAERMVTEPLRRRRERMVRPRVRDSRVARGNPVVQGDRCQTNRQARSPVILPHHRRRATPRHRTPQAVASRAAVSRAEANRAAVSKGGGVSRVVDSRVVANRAEGSRVAVNKVVNSRVVNSRVVVSKVVVSKVVVSRAAASRVVVSKVRVSRPRVKREVDSKVVAKAEVISREKVNKGAVNRVEDSKAAANKAEVNPAVVANPVVVVRPAAAAAAAWARWVAVQTPAAVQPRAAAVPLRRQTLSRRMSGTLKTNAAPLTSCSKN